MPYPAIAKELVEALGGKDNIVSISHCATRLRVMIADDKKIDKKKVELIDKVKGLFLNSGQFQVIFGTGIVNRVFEAIEKLDLTVSDRESQEKQAATQGHLFQRVIRTFGDVFVPIIPALVATGLFMGMRGLFTRPEVLAIFGLSPDAIPENFILFTQVLTDTVFIFLPALIAWSSSRVFGGSPVIGLVLGLMLVSPSLPNAWGVGGGDIDPLLFFGFIPVVGYQGSVIPAFVAGMLAAKLEKVVRNIVPPALDLILTPFITLFVMISGSLFVLGPLLHVVEMGILYAGDLTLNLPYGISGIIVGAFYQPIVATGVHHIFNLLEINQLAAHGYSLFGPLIFAVATAHGASCLAVGMKTKDAKLKALAIPSAVSQFFGIGEAALFGVNLRFVRPFVTATIAGIVGAFIASLIDLKAYGMGLNVIPGIMFYIDGQIPKLFMMAAITFALSFALTWMFGYSDKMLEAEKH